MQSKPVDPDAVQTLGTRRWVRMVVVYLFIPLLLFVCSGDIGWGPAWVFSLLIFAAGIGGRIWAEKRHPGLLVERVTSIKSENIKPWDKVLAPLVAFSISFPLVIVAGLDHRFGWTSPLPSQFSVKPCGIGCGALDFSFGWTAAFPPWLVVLGFVLVAVGYGLAVWALAENRFFSGVVRIQTDRGHTVCDSGPYRIVRHPGYLGNILPLPGIALALGSLWTLIPAAAALVIVVIRTALEDRTLQEELPGYREYAQRVRYRLFPGIY